MLKIRTILDFSINHDLLSVYRNMRNINERYDYLPISTLILLSNSPAPIFPLPPPLPPPTSYSLTIYFAPCASCTASLGAWTGFERVACLLRFLVFVLLTEGDKGRRLLMDDTASRIGVNHNFIHVFRRMITALYHRHFQFRRY